jgi:DNA-binding NarL/FixJ family response regulator
VTEVRVFHCDDSAAFRLLVREMLRDLGGVDVVGEAAALDEALAKLPAARPDVVLVDLLERGGEDELLAPIRAAVPRARMVLYTGMPECPVPGGAEAYVHKSAPFEELHRTIVSLAVR